MAKPSNFVYQENISNHPFSGLGLPVDNSEQGEQQKESDLPFWIQPDYVAHQVKFSWEHYPRAWAYWIGGLSAAGGALFLLFND